MTKAARKAFGLRLRELREAKGLSREELIRRAGLKSVESLVSWETGKREPMASTLYKLSEALGVPCDEFFEPPTTPPRGRGRPPAREVDEDDEPPSPPRRRH